MAEEAMEMGTAPASKHHHDESSRQLVPSAARRWERLHTPPPAGAGPGSGNLNLINCSMMAVQAAVHTPGTHREKACPRSVLAKPACSWPLAPRWKAGCLRAGNREQAQGHPLLLIS